MEYHENVILPAPNRTPWNKGKLIGAKPPLLARHVWSIRTRLQIGGEPATSCMQLMCVYLIANRAGHVWGLDGVVERFQFVQKHPALWPLVA